MNLAIKKDTKYSYADYIQWDDGEDWEILGGTAYNMSPSATPKHQSIQSSLIRQIGNYLVGKSCKVFSDLDVVLSDEDIVKPDIIIVCDKNKIGEKNIQGVPDFIVEILSPSTAKKDKTIKLRAYKKYGVKEYWIIDPLDNTITVHLQDMAAAYSDDDDAIPVSIFQNELNLDIKEIFAE